MCYEPAELWRFDTSTRRWEKVKNTAANDDVPSSRVNHVITSVGLDLWIHGGFADADSGEGDTCSRLTVGAEADPALGQRVCLLVPTVTVFVVVCVRHMTCVCSAHDWSATCSLIHRVVAVRHVHT